MASTFGRSTGDTANAASQHTQNIGSSANQSLKHGLNRGSETGDSNASQGSEEYGHNVEHGRSFPDKEKQGLQQNYASSPGSQHGPSGGPTQTQDYEYGGQGATGYGDSGIQGSSGSYGNQQGPQRPQYRHGIPSARGYGSNAGSGYEQGPETQTSVPQQQQPVSSQQGGTFDQSPRYQQAQEDSGFQHQQQPYRQQRGSESSQDSSTSDYGRQGGRKKSK